MVSEERYVILSLELHLFFARIMKEHAIFLEASFTPKDFDMSQMADHFKQQFEGLLDQVVRFGNGVVRSDVLTSGEIITEYTLGSEQKTENFTGITINKNITLMEAQLHSSTNPNITPNFYQNIKQLNTNARMLVESFINFKSMVLNQVLSCNITTSNYPLMLQHLLHESQMYSDQLMMLENGEDIENPDVKKTERFWDKIMMEHALFIRGMLDPTEIKLINSANDFARVYSEIINRLDQAANTLINSITGETLDETVKFRDFKESGVKGINECKIRSIIQPLLADHVLREANNYIRILKIMD
ncbi:DUF2935 domain-containing protein [Clostridioides mangenotii]|uniref:DUF2935 domain-containing protein n=1 Tax=Metaclostridioides mangenotii TaxID=1540 RepID=UPI001C0F3E65|nr:DUF2935 domain-containing protein [Clostridioides mangenotii]MBU5307469.1 DUF2935 domain-containing protein [Clostridioides mangenotii]